MNDIKRLREQAAKGRRLAAGVNDPVSKDALLRYANECDKHADTLELAAEAEKCHAAPLVEGDYE